MSGFNQSVIDDRILRPPMDAAYFHFSSPITLIPLFIISGLCSILLGPLGITHPMRSRNLIIGFSGGLVSYLMMCSGFWHLLILLS